MDQSNEQKSKKPYIFEAIFLVAIILLSLVFYFIKNSDYRIIIGSIIFGVLSARYLLFDSGLLKKLNKEEVQLKIYYIVIGFLLLLLTFFTLSVLILLPEKLDQFILFSLFMLITLVFLISILWIKLKPDEKIFSFMSLVFPLNMASVISFGVVLAAIFDSGINSLSMYLQVIMLGVICLWYTTLSVRALFEGVSIIFKNINKKITSNVFYFNIAITLNILIGGYFYLVYISQQDLRDFLIMAGALLTIWLAIYPSIFKENS